MISEVTTNVITNVTTILIATAAPVERSPSSLSDSILSRPLIIKIVAIYHMKGTRLRYVTYLYVTFIKVVNYHYVTFIRVINHVCLYLASAKKHVYFIITSLGSQNRHFNLNFKASLTADSLEEHFNILQYQELIP